jgi:proline iminopeptidase
VSVLDVGDGQRIHWEISGDPGGIPVVCVHGGPGGGGSRGSRKLFDPSVFRPVLFDQRGCGESTPNVADPAVSLTANTTWHLVEDMERLRQHIGVERWVVYGGSWGATLALAYAQCHPERVLGMILVGVTTTSPGEIEWLYRGAARFRPAEWDAFRRGAGMAADLDVSADPEVSDLIAAYLNLVSSPDAAVRERAAHDWCMWEDSLIAHETAGSPGSYGQRTGPDRIAFVRLCAHYFGNGAWLRPDQLIDDVHRIAHIPAELVHGRHDLSCPPDTVWRLARAWRAANLHIVEDSGHTGTPAFAHALRAAVDRLATALRD